MGRSSISAVSALVLMAGCGAGTETLDAGPNVALPCVLAADVDRIELDVGATRTLTLSAPMGVCVIERVRLDRQVFQIVDEPELPWTIEGGASRTLTIAHQPMGMLMMGVPVRELVFTTVGAKQRVEVVLRGVAPELHCLEAAPESIAFGGIAVGSSGTEMVVISNTCTLGFNITSAEIIEATPGFSLGQQRYPFRLEPQGTLTLGVTFTPPDSGFFGGKLKIETDDPQNPSIELNIIASVEGARLVAFPRIVEVGAAVRRGAAERSECGSAPRTLTIANSGVLDLHVERIEFMDGDGVFETGDVTIGAQTMPLGPDGFMLPVGADAQIPMRLFPERLSPAAHEVEMRIFHDAGSPARAILRGTSVPDQPALEVFRQPNMPRVDILWVTDGIGQLDPFRGPMLALSSAMLDALGDAGVDYRMGVTTTSVETRSPGILNECPGQPKLVRSDEMTLALRQELMRCLLELRVRSPQNSAGLEAATEAMSRNLNPEFIRPDAKVMVVFVSNRDEGSRVRHDALLDFLSTLKSRTRPDGATLHAIIGPPAGGCAMAEPGPRYAEAAARSGGSTFDICADDWTGFVPQMLSGAGDRNAAFKLASRLDPTLLSVTVDGRRVDSGGRGYTFDAARNAITFAPTEVPEAGATIQASYGPLCDR